MRKMVKLTENTMEVERSKQKTTEIKSTYHIQLIPHLRKVKGEKTHIFKHFNIRQCYNLHVQNVCILVKASGGIRAYSQ